MTPQPLRIRYPLTRLLALLAGALGLLLLNRQDAARAQEPVAEKSTSTASAFTYQGQLLRDSTPVDGACDLQFSLWDAASGGEQIGGLLARPAVQVVNGLFAVSLDFGAVFAGQPRWLEVSAGCPAGGALLPLAPRQELTATPYAYYAATAPWDGLIDLPAGFADGVDDQVIYTAGFGLSLTGSEFAVTGAPWSGLAGMPAGFADGIDHDTQYAAGAGLVLTGTQFSLAFGGSGSASTAARSDHDHAGAYAPLVHSHPGEAITSGTVAEARLPGSLARDAEVLGLVLAGDGAASGLDADLLDGQQGSYYLNAANLNAGTLGFPYFSAYGDLSAEGYLDLSAEADLVSRAQGDARFVNEAQADSVNSAMIASGAVTAADLQDGAALAELADDDGAGSGLDADLLDGRSSAAFTYSAGDGLSLAGNQFAMQGTSYQQVVVVAKSGGDFTTIQAALDSISDASAARRYLVWVAPGVYTERVTMKPYVDLEGANTSLTRITYGGSPSLNTGTVVAAANAELRFLTVENTGANIYAVGVYNPSASYFYLFKVQVTVSGAAQHYALYNSGGANCAVTSSALIASGEPGDLTYGIYNLNAALTVQYSQVSALGASSYGIYNQGTSGSHLVVVRDSQVSGAAATLRNDAAFRLRVAVSQLDGGAVTGSGTVCAGVYDESYAFYPGTCP